MQQLVAAQPSSTEVSDEGPASSLRCGADGPEQQGGRLQQVRSPGEPAIAGAARNEYQREQQRVGVVANKIAKLVRRHVCQRLLVPSKLPREQSRARPPSQQERRAVEAEGDGTWLYPGPRQRAVPAQGDH